MSEKRVCAICGQLCLEGSVPQEKLVEEEWQFQDTGEPVHSDCRNRTFWQQGDRVVARFWEAGGPVATVRGARVIFGKFRPVAVSDEVQEGPVEWVTVKFDDGEIKEYATWDLRKAPE